MHYVHNKTLFEHQKENSNKNINKNNNQYLHIIFLSEEVYCSGCGCVGQWTK